jgi:hypothetical protein
MSSPIYPGQTWRRRHIGNTVRVHVVDGDRIGYRKADGSIFYMPRARFVALFARMVQA